GLTYNAFRRLQGTLLSGQAINKLVDIVNPTAGNPPQVILHNFAFLSSTLSGTVTLEGCQNPAQTITFRLKRASSCGAEEQTVMLDANGGYALTVPGDTFEIRVKGAKWLAKGKALNINAATMSGLNFSLPAGDVNNDNLCDLDDLGILALAFNTA